MKPSRPLLSLAGFVLAFLVVGLLPPMATASAKKATPPAPEDDRKLIKSVDVKNSTVVIQYMHDKSTHTYKVDFATELKVNNVEGKIDGIKPGMVVDNYLERDNDDLDALTVSGYPSDAPAAKSKPTKPKPKTPPQPAPTQ